MHYVNDKFIQDHQMVLGMGRIFISKVITAAIVILHWFKSNAS